MLLCIMSTRYWSVVLFGADSLPRNVDTELIQKTSLAVNWEHKHNMRERFIVTNLPEVRTSAPLQRAPLLSPQHRSSSELSWRPEP